MRKKEVPEWNKEKIALKGYNAFKNVYEDYVDRKVLNGKYKKLTDQQMKALFDKIVGKKAEAQAPEVLINKNEK